MTTTTTTSPSQLARNQTAVRDIRGRHPYTPARTLTEQILVCCGGTHCAYVHEFVLEDAEACFRIAYNASYASIYNLIRRYDGTIR